MALVLGCVVIRNPRPGESRAWRGREEHAGIMRGGGSGAECATHFGSNLFWQKPFVASQQRPRAQSFPTVPGTRYKMYTATALAAYDLAMVGLLLIYRKV